MKLAVLLLPGLFTVACMTHPYATVFDPRPDIDKQSIKVDIVSHGWHTGLVLPASDILERLPALKKRFPEAINLEFGWGDKRFYQAREVTLGLAVQAVFWPTDTVMRVVDVPADRRRYYSGNEVKSVCFSKKQYASVISFISSSFEKDKSGQLIAIKDGIYEDSQFYAGTGKYFLMNTCNNWTAKALKSAGMDINPAFKFTSGSVMSFMREISRTDDVMCP